MYSLGTPKKPVTHNNNNKKKLNLKKIKLQFQRTAQETPPEVLMTPIIVCVKTNNAHRKMLTHVRW